jgi:hypothetical protein
MRRRGRCIVIIIGTMIRWLLIKSRIIVMGLGVLMWVNHALELVAGYVEG